MAVEPPWMYSEPTEDSRFPTAPFDPKAVTRASWTPKPKKAVPRAPYFSFNRHPDAHMVLNHRSTSYTPMSSRTKKWIRWLRRAQLVLRIVELNAAIGILVLMVLLTNINPVEGWVMRIAPGIVAFHCFYSIYHHSRDAIGRTPASSAAYQIFAALADLAALGAYTFSTFTTHQHSDEWKTRLADQDLTDIFVKVAYYGMVAAGGLHVVSLSMSLWLAWAFRRISNMPPDMNPLEDNLTARPKHKRNKSSMTTSTATESNARLSTPGGNRPRSQMSYAGSPRSMPFLHTREGSKVSMNSRDSRGDLPSRQYQIVAGNSPRHSAMSVEPKRMAQPMSAYRGSYAEIPTEEAEITDSKPEIRDGVDSRRPGKFTENWAPTHSLVSRTNERNRNTAEALRGGNRNTAYAALEQRYGLEDSDDSEYDDENVVIHPDNEADLSNGHHPNPLRSNPNPLDGTRSITNRTQTPFRPKSMPQPYDNDALSELNHNTRRVSESRDITEGITGVPPRPWGTRRDSSIQQDSSFYSKPYGELKSATPPIMVGTDRKVSSGNDYDNNKHYSGAYGRRNVSGKVVEEGLAGIRGSRYGFYSTRNY